MNLPPRVEKLVKEITEKSPGYSEAQAWATAWSVYCKHVKPGDKHCTKGPEGYLTKRGFDSPSGKLPDAQGKGWDVKSVGDGRAWFWIDPQLGIKFGVFEVDDPRNFLNEDISYLLKVRDSNRRVYQAKRPEQHLLGAFFRAKKTMMALRRGDNWVQDFTPVGGRLARRNRVAFNKYNAPEVLGQLMTLLEQFGLDEPLELMRRDRIPQVVNRAWNARERRASR